MNAFRTWRSRSPPPIASATRARRTRGHLTGAGKAFASRRHTMGSDTFAKREEPEFSADPIEFPAWDVASRHGR